MPKICYADHRFTPESAQIVQQANTIIADYMGQGFKLTLRQLYYQFVSRDLIPNTPRSYDRLGGIINDARLAGLVDWNAIEDRTREVQENPHWSEPAEIVRGCAGGYRVDKWEGQACRPEVWIEKEALAGVVAGICREMDISYLSCRGYTSQSEMWGSSCRLRDTIDNGQRPVILHFGDHDPSGIDMSRDIRDRMGVFGIDVNNEEGGQDISNDGDMSFRRMALNMDQVQEYGPPPNPAKVTDSRFESYQREYGDESWELDALEPRVMVAMIRAEVLALRDEGQWAARVKLEKQHRDTLAKASQNWDEVAAALKGKRLRKE